MNLAEFRQAYPQYSVLSDDELTTRLHAKYYASTPYDIFKEKFWGLGGAAEEVPEVPSSMLRRVGDLGISAAQGVVGLGEAAIGLADIPTFGAVGKLAEKGEEALFGGTSKDLQAYLQKQKTPEAQAAEKRVAETKGFLPTAGALIENPSALLGSVAESIPSMVGGAKIAQLGLKHIPALAGKTLTAAGIGEGAVSAGSTAEAIRQQQASGYLAPGQSGIAAVSGVLTGALGVFGGKVAKSFGGTDVDELLAGGIKNIGSDANKQSIIKAAVKGALSESLFEELPQSMQEQIALNVATGKPWDDNVVEAGAHGAMAALVMGGGGAAASQVITNANIKAGEKRRDLDASVAAIDVGKSMFDVQDEEDAKDESEKLAEQVRQTNIDVEALQEELVKTARAHFVGDLTESHMKYAEDLQQSLGEEAAVTYINEILRLQDEAKAKQGVPQQPVVQPPAVEATEKGFKFADEQDFVSHEAPLFSSRKIPDTTQQGLDFTQEQVEGQDVITPIMEPATQPKGQQTLDFLREVSEEDKTTPTEAPKVEKQKFGFTTEVSAAPLQQMLGQIKPRSSSPVEQNKQAQAITGLNDQIADLFDGVEEKDVPYYLGVVNSFFDNYASYGKESPNKQADFANFPNFPAEEQKEVLRKHTKLPDLTTYEGVKQLSDAFEDHVATAQLAGLGITRASSAYNTMDPIVRSLRAKPKASYDESERAAHSYFDRFGLDLALRSAAFDIATKAPRNSLFRGQGAKSAELFNEWLLFNAPDKIQSTFAKYVRAYSLQQEGYRSFERMAATKEAEQDYIKGYTEPLASKVGDQGTPLHPAALEHIRANNLQAALQVISVTSPSKYERVLAARLMELGLNTAVGIDIVDTITREYYDKNVKDLLGKFADGVQVYYPTSDTRAQLMDIWDNAATNKNRYASIGKAINLTKRNLEKRNLEMGGALADVWKDLSKTVKDVDMGYHSYGVYFPIADSISIDGTFGTNTRTLLHEVMHVATIRAISSAEYYPELVSDKRRAAAEEIVKLYELAKEHAGDKYFYGLRDKYEFVAEAFTNEKFQEFLQGIKYKSSNRSLWDKFVEFCLKLFGVDNVLSATIANTNALFAVPTKGAYAKAPPLYAARNASMFEGNSEESVHSLDILNDLIKNNKTWDDIKGKFASLLRTLNSQTRKHWLGAITLRQMEEIIGMEFGKDVTTGEMKFIPKIPQLAAFLRDVEAMNSKRAKILHLATTISTKLLDIQRKSKATMDKLTAIVQTSTVHKVDPTKQPPTPADPNNPTKDEIDRLKHYQLVKSEFDALATMREGLVAQNMYEVVRDFYVDRLAEFKSISKEREFNRLFAEAELDENDPDFDAKRNAIKVTAENNIDKKFAESITPYFPLKRFGEFWVRYGTGKNKKYLQFESAFAKNKYLEKVRAEYANTLRKKGFVAGKTEEEAQKLLAREVKNAGMINHGDQLASLANDLFADKAIYEEVKNIVSTAGGDTVTDPQELRELVLEQLGELYITTLPVHSIQRMFLHRSNIPGASTDLIRSFQHSAFHMAYQHARFEFGPSMDNKLLSAKSMVDALVEDSDEKARLTTYIEEIKTKYKEHIQKPTISPDWVNLASNVNFLMYLSAPASAFVNMMAVPSIALPVLGGKFGTTKSWKAITKHMKLLSGSGWKNPETGEFDTPSIGRSPGLTPLQKRAYDTLSEALFEQSLAHHAAGIAENPSLDYSGWWGKIMQVATFPFHKAERFNREITAMAAFELAYEKNGGNFDAAVREAADLTWKIMFDYATYNKPRYFQGNIAKIVFAFKQYAQHMSYLLFRTIYESTKGVSKEEYDNIVADYGVAAADKYAAEVNKLQAEARKTFMLLMGMSFVFAGAAGLPIWWMYAGMANAFNAVFGDDEVPFDVENDFKNRMNDAFGGFVGDSISRGVIPQLTGASLSDRMSTNLPDMWFRDVKKNQDEVTYLQNALINLMGPTAGLLTVGVGEAVKRFNDGQTERAVEAISPAALKNLLASVRIASKGALTMKGDTLVEDISGPEAFLQMLGFTPERLAQKQSANIEAKSAEQKVQRRKQDLLNFLAMAVEAGDTDAIHEVLEKMQKFSEANPWNPITQDTITRSMRRRARVKAEAEALGGLRVSKNFAPIAMEMTAYGDAEEDEG